MHLRSTNINAPATQHRTNICFVMPWHYSERVGGAELQAWYLAREMISQGMYVTYICQSVDPHKEDLTEVLEGVRIHWLKPSPRFEWLDLKKYRNALEKHEPEFVIQRMSSPVSASIRRYCRRHKSTFIWICTDNASCFRWMFIRRQHHENRKQGIGFVKGSVFLINALIRDILRHRGMAGVDQAFHQNVMQQNNIARFFKLNSQLIKSGHPKLSKPLEQKKIPQKPVILWVGNLGHRKYPELFISLAKHSQDKNWSFVMVGGTSNSKYFQQLKSEIPDNVIMTGRLPLAETEKWFDKAVLCINTSREEGEGFPNTFVQSWLRGIPVISFSVNPDQVLSVYKLGYRVETVEQAKEMIQKTLQDEEDYQAWSRSIRKHAEDNFTIGPVAEEFLTAITGSTNHD